MNILFMALAKTNHLFQILTFFKSKWGQALDVKDAYVFKIFKDSKLLRSLSDCNWTRTHIHVVRKQTLNNLAKLARPVWLNG